MAIRLQFQVNVTPSAESIRFNDYAQKTEFAEERKYEMMGVLKAHAMILVSIFEVVMTPLK